RGDWARLCWVECAEHVHAGSGRAVGAVVRRVSAHVRADRPRPPSADYRLWRWTGELQRRSFPSRPSRYLVRSDLSIRKSSNPGPDNSDVRSDNRADATERA